MAYLIDRANCPDQVFDEIFRESYSRWGGRRTLIVPAKPDGIDKEYADWLWYHDPDVIYSFVALEEAVVAHIHERYCPTFLKIDGSVIANNEVRTLELPLKGLQSISLVSAFLSRRNPFEGQISNLRIVDKFYDRSESQFIAENFGFLSTSHMMPASRFFPELFSTLCLISEEALGNSHLLKDASAKYVTSETKLLEEFAAPGSFWTVASASDFLAPSLSMPHDEWSYGTSIIIGDSIDDRLLFWNQHHRRDDAWQGSISGLRISPEKFADPEFVAVLKKILLRRGSHHSGNLKIKLRSCSLSEGELSKIAEKFKGQGFWPLVSIEAHSDASVCVPKFQDRYEPSYRYSIGYSGLRIQESVEFSGNKARAPSLLPWHMREALPPTALRLGSWITDLEVSRHNDNSRYSNVRESWAFPRRLRLERAVKITWPDDQFGFLKHVTRVTRHGLLAAPAEYGQPPISLELPDDVTAFRTALCLHDEWNAAEHNARTQGFKRYAQSEVSDKGRYLIEVLQHFEGLPEAFSILMHAYWRDILISLGAAPVEKNEALRDELLVTLRKRLGQKGGPLKFETAEQLDRLAREAIRSGRQAGSHARVTNYKTLLDKWAALVEQDLEAEHHLSEEDKKAYRDPLYLENALQLVCQRKLFFQGIEWRCRRCFNRNWTSIDNLRSQMACEVCREEAAAPVSGDWNFKPNDFIIAAYREHGVEPVIWTLWRLWHRAREAFYFTPSLNLWETNPTRRDDGEDIELDALAVVDGALYLCEVKTSSGLGQQQIDQLISAARRVRPDVLLISCADKATSKMKAAIAKIQESLGDDIKVELLELLPEMLEKDSATI